MYLEKIEIQGFKSFANQSELVFNRELTAIVGPNGSGKSNVADAIRWVLGEQSMKLLRGKKSDDVIFAGSDTKGRLGFARVALYLNNKNRRADIDYDELVIERAIQRNGEGEYKLNGSKVRLTDIQLLLARASVGQKSYSVVGQGMIDSLLTLSAQERRDFFDEATGVKQYQIKKQQALLKLEHTEENLQQAELVLQELDPRLRTLTRQVRRLEKKEELQKDLTSAQEEYYGYLKTDIEANLESLTKKRSASEKHIDELNKKLLDIQQKVDEYGLSQSRNTDYNTLQSKLFAVQQEYNNLTKKRIVLEGQKDVELIKQGEGQSVIIQQRIAELKTKKDNLESQLKNLSKTTRESSELVDSLEAKLSEIGKKADAIEKELSGDSAIDWDSVEKEAQSLNYEHDQIMSELEEVTDSSLTEFKKKLSSFSKRLQSFFKTVKHNSQHDSKALWKSFSSLTSERDVIQRELNNHRVRLQLNEQQHSLLTEQKKELENEIKDLERSTLTDGSARQKSVAVALKDLDNELEAKQKEMDTVRKEIENFNSTEEAKKTEIVELQKKSRTIQYDLGIKNNELTSLKVEVAKYETRQEDLEKEMSIEAPGISYKKVTHLNTGEVRTSIENIKRQLNIIGGIDEETVSEYQEVKEKHDYLTQQTTDLRKAQSQLIELVKDLDKQINKQFESAFKNINTHFTKYFKKLFDGGSAKLNLTMMDHDDNEEAEEESDVDDERKEATQLKHKKLSKQLNYSIEVTATPPGKKLSSVNVLSGGEKALTSIALICAIIANNPPPFVVLDEVDAALDEANSIRFAEIISELTHETQFVTVTHNRATMHQAKILYGVTMGSDGISRLLSVNFEEADELSA